MSENKTGKYFKYAIGEIILVVIGILIALQVNNWNEERKVEDFQVKILMEIQNNLRADVLEIREDLELMADINKACAAINTTLKSNSKPTDSFAVHAAMLRVTPHFSPITSSYKLLESRGMGSIKNDSLRDAISYHYDMLYPYYKTYEDERTRFHALHSEPKLLTYFDMYWNEFKKLNYLGLRFEISEEDYVLLSQDKDFLKLVTAIAFENMAVESRAKRVEKGLLKLIDEIENELSQTE